MPSSNYSFLDIAVLEEVRARFASGDALAVLSTDLNEVIWANGPGASVFGYPDIEAIIGSEPSLGFAARRQITATSGYPDIGRDRGVMVRLATGMNSRAVGFLATRLTLPDGESAILLAIPANPATGVADERALASRAISGFSEPGHFAAIVDGAANVTAASDGFSALGISTDTLSALIMEVAGEKDRLAKRMIQAGSMRLPAGFVRLTDEPAKYFLVVVDEAGAAGETALAEVEVEAVEATAAGAADHAEAKIEPVSDSVAPVSPDDAKPSAEHDIWYFSTTDAPESESADSEFKDGDNQNISTDDHDHPETVSVAPEPMEHGAPSYEEPAATQEVEAPIQPEVDRAAAPIRFVWRTDAEGRFSALSDEFARAVGKEAADVIGRRFGDVASVFDLDPDREIAGLLERRDTWSGRSVLWPVAGTDLRVPVDLAALPVYGRNRDFEGFRGFGVARTADAIVDPQGLGLTLVRPAPAVDGSTGDESHSTGLQDEVPAASQDTINPADPFKGEVPVLTIVPKQDRRYTDKVIRLAEHRAPAANDKGLTPVERSAFREIGDRLKKDSDPVVDAATPVETALPADLPATDDVEPDAPTATAQFEQQNEPPFETVDRDAAFEAAILEDLARDEADAVDETTATLSAQTDIDADHVRKVGDASEIEDGASIDLDDVEALDRGETEEFEASGAALQAASYLADDDRALIDEPELDFGAPEPVENDDGGNAFASPADPVIEAEQPEGDRPDISEGTDTVAERDGPGETIGYDEVNVLDTGKPEADFEQTGIGQEPEGFGDTGQAPALETAEPLVLAEFADSEAGTLEFAETDADLSAADSDVVADSRQADNEHDPAEPEPVGDVPSAFIRPIRTDGFLPSAFAMRENHAERAPVDTSILAQLPVPVLIHSGDELHYANQEFLQFTGYASVEALADAGGLGELFGDPYQEKNAEGETERKMRLRTREGLEFPVEAFLQSVPWSGSKALLLALRRVGRQPVRLPAVAAATVEHADLEARVAEMRTILDTATDGVVLIANDGTIRSISRPAEALFGFDSGEVSGKPFASLFAIESQRAARDYLNGLAENGVASVLNDGREVIGREAQGRFIPLFMTIGKLPNNGGYCAVLRDITQWKSAEEDLTQARALAERASSQKTDFLARVSHEIRTPLNAIIGFSELMVDEKFGPISNDRYRDYLRDINRSGNHVLDLVNDLLDISKIEAGQQEMSYEAVSLNDTLAETVAMMQPQANRERVIIRSSFASKLPEVVADLRSVRQIALNLLSNAIRYTQAGGQVIVSTAYESAGDVIVRVRDTGIGMSQAEIEQAMKPFKQINSLKRARGDGTGLGLPLTKAMVEANRAKFTINSTPGEGTLVEITFPSTRVLAE